MDNAFVILGEASESDEEETVVLSVVRGKDKLSTNRGVIIAGEASESDSEHEDAFREAFIARNGAVANTIEEDSQAGAQYDTLLHKKLRECNESLHKNINQLSRQGLTNAIRTFNSTNQQLLATQVLIQDAATSFTKAFDNLDKLRHSLDTLLATPYVPEINIV